MEVTAVPTTHRTTQREHVIEGERVLLKINNGKQKFVAVNKDVKTKIGKDNCCLDSIIGCRYGTVFEVSKGKLLEFKERPKDTFETSAAVVDEKYENNIKTNNSQLVDNNSAQKLTQDEINELKKKGLSGEELVKVLAENSATFASKTEFSQEKYLKKKEKKHAPRVTVVKCTVQTVCEAYYLNGRYKIANLRIDTLAQMLRYGNIGANQQVLVVDECQGLLVSSVADRIGGFGRILNLFSGQQPTIEILKLFNFSKSILESVFNFPLSSIRELKDTTISTTTENEETIDNEPRKKQKLENTEAKVKKTYNIENMRKFLTEGCHSLLIVTQTPDPTIVLLELLQYLLPSHPFVVFSQYLQPLAECLDYLRANDIAIALHLTETWMREYQVLPRRTHPLMQMDTASGYLLWGIKVEK